MVQNSVRTEGYTGKSCPSHSRSTTLSCPFPVYPFWMSLCTNKCFVCILSHFCLAVKTFVLLFFPFDTSWRESSWVWGMPWFFLMTCAHPLSSSFPLLAQGLWKAGPRTEAPAALSPTWDPKIMTFLLTAPWETLGKTQVLIRCCPHTSLWDGSGHSRGRWGWEVRVVQLSPWQELQLLSCLQKTHCGAESPPKGAWARSPVNSHSSQREEGRECSCTWQVRR